MSRYRGFCHCIHHHPTAAKKGPSITHYGGSFGFDFFMGEVLSFLMFNSWGFVVINLILTAILYKCAQTKLERPFLIAFNILIIIAITVSTILNCIEMPFFDGKNTLKAYDYITIFLVDLPNLMATLLLAVVYGHEAPKNNE